MASAGMLLILVVPQAFAQVRRPMPSRPTHPVTATAAQTALANQIASMNSMNVARNFFVPAFNVNEALRHHLAVADRRLFHQILLNRYLLNRTMYGYRMPVYGYGYGYSYPMTGYSAASGYYPAISSYYAPYAYPSLGGSEPTYTTENKMSYSNSAPAYESSSTPSKVDLGVLDGPISERKITVPVGTTVEWTNLGEEPHTIEAIDGSWRATLKPNESFSRTFLNAGTYQYYAGEDQQKITATIVVTEK